MNVTSPQFRSAKYAPQPTAPMSTESLAIVVEQIFQARRITRDHQQLMMQLLTCDALSEQDHALINQVYDGLRKGFLRVA